MTILDSKEYARQVRLSSNTIKVKVGGSLNVLNKETIIDEKKNTININNIILKDNNSLMISSKNNISLDKKKLTNKINIEVGNNNSLNVFNKVIINKDNISLGNIELVVKGKKDDNELLKNYNKIRLRNESLRVSRVDKSITEYKPIITSNKLRLLNNSPTLFVNKKLSTENNAFTIDSKDVIIETNITKANGIDSLSVTISAGKKCLVRIKEKDSIINVKYIKGLPSSLYFDEVDSTIKGIAFITGEHLVRIGLDSGMEVRLLLIVVPDDVLKVL